MDCQSCTLKLELDAYRGKTSPAGRWAARAIENGTHNICKSDEERAAEYNDFSFSDGAYRWDSNGNVIPEDCMVKMGFSVEDIIGSQKVRKVETAAFLDEYRKAQANVEPSAEELAEMRAAFGEGEVVVNVLTGRRTQL